VLEAKGDSDNGKEPSNTESFCLCDPFASFRVVSQRSHAKMTARQLMHGSRVAALWERTTNTRLARM
jgi:hypothetical protein